MVNFLQTYPFVVGALTGSLATYILGLIVSYVRREKRWLGYAVSSRNIVQKGDTKLEMKYSGTDIVRLDSHTITIRNIGNRPLISIPVQLQSVDGGQIFEPELHTPDGASCTHTYDGIGKLIITADLLNPGEMVTIGLTISDSKNGEIKVTARGELLEVKEIGEQLDVSELIEVLMQRSPLGGVVIALFKLIKVV